MSTAAGYIVHNDNAIWGVGATADAAWEDFRAGMREAGVVILTTDQDADEQLGSWTREGDYTIRPATAALLAEVAARGGAIAWGEIGRVACTIEEEAAGV